MSSLLGRDRRGHGGGGGSGARARGEQHPCGQQQSRHDCHQIQEGPGPAHKKCGPRRAPVRPESPQARQGRAEPLSRP
ncbi:hypothetical protein DB31_2441 [Hyalangium minutum]|uniref:Uncharacterized protein n=1 Tax=Hyalangium minutum TaxID=394096 RepID=A0A085W8L5_9BACT|nr:hypothetical protein DB31_2441 [Hyalangium minutum]